MDIDTEAIRRLRDALLEEARDQKAGRPDAPEDVHAAVLRRIEPFAETMYLVMAADGRRDPTEQAALAGALSVLSDGQLAEQDIQALLETFAERMEAAGAEARIASLGARLSADRDDRETAFALAAVVALADTSVDPRENDVLDWVREYCGVSRRRVAQILGELD